MDDLAASAQEQLTKLGLVNTETNDRDEWEEMEAVELESDAQLRMWTHKKTGARLRLVYTMGPMANLYAVVATEAVTNEWSHCDDGLPHTLEHLIFLGSKKFPYKGVLDKLANRCLARGTNAWTDVDHTAYTATTAGSKGLLELLPIYIDHILQPTLSDAGFLTEVHHLTGEGEDKGVVYCEMQGRETTAESVAERACLRALYPEVSCGYASETGGMCDNLRKLTNEQVCQYHRDFYRPQNLCLIVTGGVDADELLSVSHKALMESSDLAMQTTQGRPWHASTVSRWIPPTERIIRVEFPAAPGEETGVAVLAWRGTKYGSYFEDTKQAMLWSYLTDGAAAVLTRAFVNSGDCSGVFPAADTLSTGYRQLWFEDVDESKLESIDSKFQAVLDAIHGQIDIKRMRDVVERAKRRTTAAIEDDPATTVVSPVLKHFLYAEDMDDSDTLAEAADPLRLLEMVEKVDEAEWRRSLLDLVKKPRITVLARPSAAVADAQRDEELGRIDDMCKSLGEEGLQRKARELEDAVKTNEAPPPKEMLRDAVKPPDIKEAVEKMFSVQHKTIQSVNGQTQVTDSVQGTKFCRVDLALSTRHIPLKLRQYLPLLAEVVFKCPYYDTDGALVPYDVAVEELRRETVTYSAGWGLAGSGTGEFFFIGTKLEKENLQFGPRLARRALIETKLDDQDRLSAAVSKLALEFSTDLRDGSSVARMALRAATFSAEDTNEGLLLAAPQRLVLDGVKKALSSWGRMSGARKKFLAELEALRQALLTAPAHCRVAGDFSDSSQQRPLDELSAILGETRDSSLTVVPKQEKPWGRRVVVGVASLEGGSAFVARCAPGPNIDDIDALASLAVVIEYLTALEGDFWTKIRGTGLAYGASLRTDAAASLVHFGLYRSADPGKALSAAAQVVMAYSRRELDLRKVDLENARGSLASGLVSAEKTRSAALASAWRRELLSLEPDRHVKFLTAVANVTEAQALQALDTWLVPLFRDVSSITTISCAPAKLSAVAAATALDKDNTCSVAIVPDIMTTFKLAAARPKASVPVLANDALLKSSSFLKKASIILTAAAAGLALTVIVLKRSKRAS